MRKLKLLIAAAALMMGVGTASAQETPANDGIYYMYNESSGLFLSRGESWGTHAVAKPIGMPWKISIADGKYSLRMYDLVVAGNNNGFTADCYTDNNTPIQFTPDGDATNGFTLKNGDNYITCPENAGVVSLSTTSSAWQFLTQAQYDAVLAAKVTAQEAAIATAKGITIPAGQTLNDVVTDANNWTASATVNDGLPTSDKWTATNHTARGGQYINWGNYGTEMYQVCNGHYARTITGLKQGIYKVSIRAMKRVGSNQSCYTMGQAGYPVSDSYLSANGNIIRIKAWYEDCVSNGNPNSTGEFVNISNNGGYTTEGFVYVGSDGNLVLDVSSEAYWGSCWLLLNGISYTFYNNEVSDEDATTILNTANSIIDSKMGNSEKSALTSTKSAFEANRTIANYNALNTAITNATASIAIYEEAKAILDAANAFDATGQAHYAANETIAAIQTAYDNGTLEALTNEQKAAAQEALSAACKAQTQPADNSDMSACIQNWDFLNCENNNYPGWTIAKTTGYANKYGTTCVEYWNGSAANGGFDYYQTITDLPTGVYTIQGNMWNSTDNEDGAAGVNGECGVYGKSTSDEVFGGVTEDTRDGGKAVYTTGEIIVVDGILRVGVKNNTTMGGRWFGVDWIKLTYARQLTNEEITGAYNEALAAAQAIVQGTIPTAAYNALSQVIAANTLTEGTAAQYAAAATALSAAAAAAAELVEPYATWLTLKAQAQALATGHETITGAINKVITYVETLRTADDLNYANATATTLIANYVAWYDLLTKAVALKAVANDNEDANTTLGNVITTQTGIIVAKFQQIENATVPSRDDLNDLVNYIPVATTNLRAAMVAYAGDANPVDGAQFDLTFMLINPDVTKFWNGTWWIQPDGWYKEQNDGNFQVMSNGSVDAEDDVHKVFVEYYYLNNGKTYDNGKFNIYTKTQEDLPAGTYTLSCYAFAKEENYSSGNPNPQVYFYANDTQGSLVSSNRLTEQSISFVNETEQVVMVGLKPLAGNTYNWMGIGYVQLYKVPAKTYTVDETVAWDATTEGAGDVTLNRNIKEGVNTVTFPFSMNSEEVEAKFGVGSQVYTLKSYNATTENLSFETHDGISANLPCLLKATVGGTNYELVGRTIVAGIPETEVNGAKMIGTYDAEIYAPQGSYIINNKNDEAKIYFVDSEETVTLKNTRAYIELTASEGARILTFTLDGGETTGIATLENGELKIETGTIYDLSGRRVTAPAKGVYIINGKKVVK